MADPDIPYYGMVVRAGYDWWVNLSYTDPTGLPIPLTGLTLTWTISVNSTTYILTNGSGLTVNAGAGTLVAALTNVQTAAFTKGSGTHYFDIIDSLSRKIAWFNGSISVVGL